MTDPVITKHFKIKWFGNEYNDEAEHVKYEVGDITWQDHNKAKVYVKGHGTAYIHKKYTKCTLATIITDTATTTQFDHTMTLYVPKWYNIEWKVE